MPQIKKSVWEIFTELKEQEFGWVLGNITHIILGFAGSVAPFIITLLPLITFIATASIFWTFIAGIITWLSINGVVAYAYKYNHIQDKGIASIWLKTAIVINILAIWIFAGIAIRLSG